MRHCMHRDLELHSLAGPRPRCMVPINPSLVPHPSNEVWWQVLHHVDIRFFEHQGRSLRGECAT